MLAIANNNYEILREIARNSSQNNSDLMIFKYDKDDVSEIETFWATISSTHWVFQFENKPNYHLVVPICHWIMKEFVVTNDNDIRCVKQCKAEMKHHMRSKMLNKISITMHVATILNPNTKLNTDYLDGLYFLHGVNAKQSTRHNSRRTHHEACQVIRDKLATIKVLFDELYTV